MSRARVGVLISGRGSNMQALIAAAQAADCPFEVAVVIANRPQAPGLAMAAEAGIATLCLDHQMHGADRESHERQVHQALTDAGCQWVALAGYMRVLSPYLVGSWQGRMINIHPSLLPLFPGLHTHERALQAGVKLHGASVHLVEEGVDQGPLLGQAAVPVLPGDTADSLGARVLAVEHRLYPATLAALVSGRRPGADASAWLINI